MDEHPIPDIFAMLPFQVVEVLAETLLVWGAQDRLIVPAYARRWQSFIPAARLEVVDGAGHMLPYEQPDAFVRAVQTFLA